MIRFCIIRHFNIRLIISSILFCFFFSYNSKAQKDSITRKYNSFSIKYDIGQWLCQYPNLQLEYRFSKRIAINITGINITRGNVWPLNIFTIGTKEFNQYRIIYGKYESQVEQWPLNGYMLKAGMKFYFYDHYFVSPFYYFKYQRYKSFYWGNVEYSYNEDLSVKDKGIGLIIGLEGRRQKYLFGEWYAGIGIMRSNTKKSTKQLDPMLPFNYPYPTKYSNHSNYLPSIFLGYNICIGDRKYLLIDTNKKKISILPKNSLYYDYYGHWILGTFNYEREILNKNSFYLNFRLAISWFPPIGNGGNFFFTPYFMLNNQLRFSNRCSFEAALGLRSFDISNAIVSQFGFRYNAPKGFLLRFSFNQYYAQVNHNIEDNLLQPSISMGYCFGK